MRPGDTESHRHPPQPARIPRCSPGPRPPFRSHRPAVLADPRSRSRPTPVASPHQGQRPANRSAKRPHRGPPAVTTRSSRRIAAPPHRRAAGGRQCSGQRSAIADRNVPRQRPASPPGLFAVRPTAAPPIAPRPRHPPSRRDSSGWRPRRLPAFRPSRYGAGDPRGHRALQTHVSHLVGGDSLWDRAGSIAVRPSPEKTAEAIMTEAMWRKAWGSGDAGRDPGGA